MTGIFTGKRVAVDGQVCTIGVKGHMPGPDSNEYFYFLGCIYRWVGKQLFFWNDQDQWEETNSRAIIFHTGDVYEVLEV